MNAEKQFYNELANTPPLPSSVYENVNKAITLHHNNVIKRTLFSLAASVVLVIGSLHIVNNQGINNTTIQPEVASELQNIRDYLNGDDIQEDFDLYAVVDGY